MRTSTLLILGMLACPLVAAAAGPEAVSDAELERVLKDIHDMPATVDRTAVVTEAVRRRFVTSDQALQLLESIPPGCGRLEAALFVYDRLVDPENYYRVYELFPDVGDQQELKKHAEKKAGREEPRVSGPRFTAPRVPMGHAETPPERGEETAFVKVDVTDTEGTRLEDARVYFCGKGPLSAPIDDTVSEEPWLSYGCELQVWIGDRMVYNEHFIPVDGKVFERRVRVDYY